jgi:hypothetical protein
VTTKTVTLSSFVQAPTKVIDALDDGDVLLTRRSGESLRLSKAVDADRELSSMQKLAQLIAASLDDEVTARIAGHMAEPFPWIELLPPESRNRFVGEFLRLARACAAVGRFERLAVALEAWEATAEAYADPDVRVDGSDLEYLAEPEPVSFPLSSR